MDSSKLIFIVNPVAGTGKWKGIEKAIETNLSSSFSYDIFYTNYSGEAKELAQEWSGKCSAVIAIGGDGLVNEIAAGIMNSSSVLGIIPTGSGNALARHLHIPVNKQKAIKIINEMKINTIDTALINSKSFIAIAGTGFDADVAATFAVKKRRGLFTYLYISFFSYFTYHPSYYEIKVDGKIYNEHAFLVSIANGSQYGNNACISPGASVRDGELNVCILKSFPKIIGPWLAAKLFLKNINKSSYYKVIKGKDISIKKCPSPLPTYPLPLNFHFDGEVSEPKESLNITIVTASLKVICPEGYSI